MKMGEFLLFYLTLVVISMISVWRAGCGTSNFDCGMQNETPVSVSLSSECYVRKTTNPTSITKDSNEDYLLSPSTFMILLSGML